MKIIKGDTSCILKITVGEEIIKSLKEFMRHEKLQSASFTGIGATERCVIGYFDRENKVYLNKTVDTVCEITSLVGNLGWDENNEPMVHAHITLGFPDYHVEGGHLVEGVIGVVGEIIVVPNSERIVRRVDEKFGLMLMS
ncbi:MAG: PPC domain-containing DNA-binding protein [bacterium]